VWICNIHLPGIDLLHKELFAAFYTFQASDFGEVTAGIIVVHCDRDYGGRSKDMDVEFVDNELDLINNIIDKVVDLDPDVIVGWEVQNASWGYLAVRGRTFGRSFSVRVELLNLSFE
jgi:DNA polymerase zeta